MSDSGMRLRKQKQPVEPVDPRLLPLQDADADYHRLCIDLQAPTVPLEQLPLDELADAARAIIAAVEDLRSESPEP